MFKLNLKIAMRNLWRNRGITAMNIGGLAVALAAFVLVTLYFNYETGYDKTNPNYENVYLVGRISPDFKTNYTSPPLVKAIRERFPEIERAGLTKNSYFELAIKNKDKAIFTKKVLAVDYEAAKILNIAPEQGLVRPGGEVERLLYLSKESMQTLFPDKKDQAPEIVGFGSSTSGQTGTISGVITGNTHSTIEFDAVSLGNDIGNNENYGYNNYNTYILVKPGTDIARLQQKITDLYREELLKGETDQQTIDHVKRTAVFLDPLANLHLKPQAGSDAPYKILVALAALGLLTLVIACVNFTNLSIAQAAKRAKEVGVKKVMGAYRLQLTFQFLIEILLQCFFATVLSIILAELALPVFNNLFQVKLAIWQVGNDLFWQLPLILLLITAIAGIYPALILSGFKPAMVLKGNFATSKHSFVLRNLLLVFQFSIAVIFCIGLFIINAQLNYMRTQDIGFNANQVVYIKNITIFNKPEVFAPVREKILKIPGVQSATVATAIPDGSKNGANGYTLEGQDKTIGFVDVDFDYFQTLDIKLKEGRFFSADFKTDTANAAILNETAVKTYGVTDPIGKIIRGCGTDYKIVGIVKDLKAQGFENAVEPTIYTIKNPCGNQKLSVLLKIEESQMAAALAALKSQWPSINPKDGEDFRYEFLDERYGKLFKKQEQLQAVFFSATVLTLVIAALGLFALARYLTNSRTKEIAVRKILGASTLHMLQLLNRSFLILVVVSNLIAWPVAYVLIKKWLDTFVYRVELSAMPFLISALITVLISILTVSMQARKAINANPVDALKYE